MTERTRREFLASVGTMMAATASAKAGVLPMFGKGITAREGQPFVGIQMSPHTMLYEGIDQCLDLIQKTGGVNAVYPYSHAFHTNSLGQPIANQAPDHGKPPRDFRGKLPMVWVKHHDKFFKNTSLRIKPVDAGLEFANRDLFKELIEPSRKRGITVHARILEGSGRAIENFDLVRTIDVYGKQGTKVGRAVRSWK